MNATHASAHVYIHSVSFFFPSQLLSLFIPGVPALGLLNMDSWKQVGVEVVRKRIFPGAYTMQSCPCSHLTQHQATESQKIKSKFISFIIQANNMCAHA